VLLVYLNSSMKAILVFCIVALMVTLNTSCSYFSRSKDSNVVFIVKSNTLNIRNAASTNSSILGVLHKGDTVFPVRNYIYWVKFKYNDGIAFVNGDYLTSVVIPNKHRVSNMKLGTNETIIHDYLYEYVNWRTWMFWAIAFGLFIVCLILKYIGHAIDDAWYWQHESMGRLYYFSAFIGVLFSFIYIVWREDFLQALFVTKFWWLPEGKEWIPWYLWSSTVFGLLGLLFFWIQDIIDYGFRGILRSILYSLFAIITFVTAFYWGIVIVVFLVFYLFISILSIFFSANSPSDNEQIAKITSLFNMGYRGEMLKDKFLNWFYKY